MRLPTKATTITAVVAGIIGIAIGSAGSSDTSDTEAAPTPATVTTTEAGPTPAAVTTTETTTETKTETKTVTPPSCVDALDASEVIVTEDMVAVLDVVAELPALIPRAIQAGVDVDVAAVRGVTSDLKDQNRRIAAINADLDRHISAYNEAATDCRSAS